jgi:hypothetical protein
MMRPPFITPSVVAITCTAYAQLTSHFSASVGDSDAHTYTVELRDNKLLYSHVSADHTIEVVTISPSAEKWRQFDALWMRSTSGHGAKCMCQIP